MPKGRKRAACVNFRKRHPRTTLPIRRNLALRRRITLTPTLSLKGEGVLTQQTTMLPDKGMLTKGQQRVL